MGWGGGGGGEKRESQMNGMEGAGGEMRSREVELGQH